MAEINAYLIASGCQIRITAGYVSATVRKISTRHYAVFVTRNLTSELWVESVFKSHMKSEKHKSNQACTSGIKMTTFLAVETPTNNIQPDDSSSSGVMGSRQCK